MNTKRQRLRAGSYEKLDQAIFKWLLTVRSRDVAVSALMFKTKAIDFAEKMSIENFQMVGLTAGKSDTMYPSNRSLAKEMRAPMK